MTPVRCVVKHFDQLTASELLDLAILRVAVFVVEQSCAYQEMDEQDRSAWHVLLYAQNGEGGERLTACSRLFSTTLGHFTEGEGVVMATPTRSPETVVAAFGRVAAHRAYRGGGLGKRLVTDTIAATQQQFPHLPIYIGAQAYLERFYGTFGFTRESSTFLEDGIPHIVMMLPATTPTPTP